MQPTIATMPDTRVQLSFTNPWSTPSWVDIGSNAAQNGWMRKFSTKIGRQHERDQFVAGQSLLTLDNRDARFSPYNTTGPYAAMGLGLVPEMPLRILSIWPNGGNMLSANEASFEGGLDTWTAAAHTTVAQSSTHPLDGTHTMLVNGDGVGLPVAVTGSKSALPNTAYTALVSVAPVSTAVQCYVGLYWLDVNGAFISESTSSLVTESSGSYIQLVLTATSPSNAASVQVHLHINDSTTNGHTVDCAALFCDGSTFTAHNTAFGTAPTNWRAGVSAIVNSVFYGYVDNWEPVFQNVMSGDYTVQVSDVLANWAALGMTSTLLETNIEGLSPLQVYYIFGDAPTATQAADSSGSGHAGGLLGVWQLAQPSLASTDPNTSIELTANDSTTGLSGKVSIPLSVLSGVASPNNVEVGFLMETSYTPPGGNSLKLFEADYLSLGVLTAYATIEVTPTGAISFLCNSGGITTTGVNVSDGKEHFVYVKFQVSNSATTAVIYVDGVLRASGSVTTTAPVPTLQQLFLEAVATSGDTTQVIFQHFFLRVKVGATMSPAFIAQLWQYASEGFLVQDAGARITQALNNAGFPAALQSIEAGISQLQGATSSLVGNPLLTYLQQCEQSESGLLFQGPDGVVRFYNRHHVLTKANSTTSQATFEDVSSSTYFFLIDNWKPSRDNLDLWNEVTASAQQGTGSPATPSGAVQVYEDTASQANYVKRSKQGPTLLVTTDAEALEWVQWEGGHDHLPKDRVRTITLDSTTNNGANLPQMLGRALMDRITVIFHGQLGGTAFSQPSLIEGVEHVVTPDTWVTTFRLSPAELQSVLILDSTSQGVLDQDLWGY